MNIMTELRSRSPYFAARARPGIRPLPTGGRPAPVVLVEPARNGWGAGAFRRDRRAAAPARDGRLPARVAAPVVLALAGAGWAGVILLVHALV